MGDKTGICISELDRGYHVERGHIEYPAWPLPNVWLGVSVENQEAADERIPELLRTPAAVRFLSCEPLLGEVSLRRWVFDRARAVRHMMDVGLNADQADDYIEPMSIDWVIAGCEPGARPCDVEWLRSLRDQCAAAGVPYFLKQATSTPGQFFSTPPQMINRPGTRELTRHSVVHQVVTSGDRSKRKPGGVIELPYLDGVQHAAFPAKGESDA